MLKYSQYIQIIRCFPLHTIVLYSIPVLTEQIGNWFSLYTAKRQLPITVNEKYRIYISVVTSSRIVWYFFRTSEKGNGEG